MTYTARYDLDTKLPPEERLTQCDECGLNKPDTEYYKRHPATCSLCIDEAHDKHSPYRELTDLQWEYAQDEAKKRWDV